MKFVPFLAETLLRRFGSKDEDKLRAALAEQARGLILTPILSPREVTFTNDGTTVVDGYRLSRLALHQLCERLARGLFSLILDLSGEQPAGHRAGSSPDLHSRREALALFNRLVERRFANLSGWQLLRDTHRRVIDAVCGSTYALLPHLEFCQRVQEVLRGLDRPPRFLEAVCRGRILTVRYYDARTLVDLDGEERILRGWSFVNGESGITAVSVAALLIHDPSRAVAVDRPRQRLHHYQGNFDARLQAVLVAALRERQPASTYAAQFRRLREQDLGLGSGDSRREESRRQELCRELARLKVTAALARDTICRLVRAHPLEDSARRSAFDLYLLLGTAARELAPGRAERLEQAAYRLLTRKSR